MIRKLGWWLVEITTTSAPVTIGHAPTSQEGIIYAPTLPDHGYTGPGSVSVIHATARPDHGYTGPGSGSGQTERYAVYYMLFIWEGIIQVKERQD